MDTTLRELDRNFQQSNSVEDEAALLRGLLRANYLSQEQVVAASKLLYPAARILYPDYSCPLVGGGVPFYEAVEDFLFSLVTLDTAQPSPELPFHLALSYLEQAQSIFEINPVEDLLLLNQQQQLLELGISFDRYAAIAREAFNLWIETRWDSNMHTENTNIITLAIAEAAPVWDLAAHADFEGRDNASFQCAANAYANYSRAIAGSMGDTSLNPRIFTSLRLAIGDVIDSFAELPPHLPFEVVQLQLVDAIRDEIIPLILDY